MYLEHVAYHGAVHQPVHPTAAAEKAPATCSLAHMSPEPFPSSLHANGLDYLCARVRWAVYV